MPGLVVCLVSRYRDSLLLHSRHSVLYIPPATGSVVLSNCSDGDSRLVGGSVENEGRVEICINRVWGSVCGSSSSYYYYSSYWGVTDARVVCRQLGYQEFGELCLPYALTMHIF